MALYAFDGTWNKDKKGTAEDTNVLLFQRAYDGPSWYRKGVGTRFGLLGKVVGGITGAGGRSRVAAGLKQLRKNLKKGDSVVDVIGFSRGAALALHFTNQIAEAHLKTAAGSEVRVRFLGLWDDVPSFGIASLPANVGWDLDLPDLVDRCCHALSLDERRHTFRLHRPEDRAVTDVKSPSVLTEVWFRGVHSDVGGGNRNAGLSSIALNWMFAHAQRAGLTFDATAVAKNAAKMKPAAPISVHSVDPIKNRFRTVRKTDQVHVSVSRRKDTKARQHNNPPAGTAVVGDDGKRVRGF